MQVEDVGYFQSGWDLILPDEIQLEDQSQPVRISNIDYANNILTVDSLIFATLSFMLASFLLVWLF